MPERKYAMTKVAAGDWLLPDNDGVTLWRLAVYEDGPSHGLVVEWPDRDFWGVWKWKGRLGGTDTIDTTDWNAWDMRSSGAGTRAEAIEEALRLGEGGNR